MNRVIVNEGTKVNLYNLFEDLQNYTSTNSANVLTQLFSSFGISALTTTGGGISSSDTSFKVTGVNGTNYVSIGVGEAITSGLHYLNVHPGQTVPVTSLTDGRHTLYARHAYLYDTPANVVSGFAYSLSGTNTLNSRAHDTTTFVWDTDPGISGIMLASVPVSFGLVANAVNLITDLRGNFLKLSTEVLGENILRTDRTFAQTLAAGLTVPALTVNGTSGPLITLTSGMTSVTLSLAQLQTLLGQTHAQNTDIGTTSSTFTVGIGGTQQLVMLEPDAPMPPKNFKVIDVYSPTYSRVRDTALDANLADAVRTGLISHEASISLTWNYTGIAGVGGQGVGGVTDSGKFRIVNSEDTRTWAANELTGYHLFLRTANKDFKIVSNLATSNAETILTVVPYKHSTPVDGLYANPRAAYEAVIHSNCDGYEIVAVPTNNAGEEAFNERYEFFVNYQSGVTSTQAVIDLFLGERVSIRIRAKYGSSYSDYVELQAGYYTKSAPYMTMQLYTRPFVVQLPWIDSTGAKIGANQTSSGFTITIVGWEAATDFEICYTTDAAGPDFLNTTHEIIVSRKRSVDIAVSDSKTYYIAVRPLISGQAVAVAKTTQVVSGAGGSKSKDNSFDLSNITFKTYSGRLSTYSIATMAWGFTSCYTPATNTTSATTIDDSVIGSYITIGGTDYLITDRMGQGLCITTLTGTEVTAGFDNAAYQINTSKASRIFMVKTDIPIDIQITSVSVEQWSTPGRSSSYRTDTVPVIRWYQGSMESYADSMPLSDTGSATYNQATDVTVLAQNGNRTLIVDYWDPTLDDNLSGFVGNISVFWKPYVATGRRTDNTIAPGYTIS